MNEKFDSKWVFLYVTGEHGYIILIYDLGLFEAMLGIKCKNYLLIY